LVADDAAQHCATNCACSRAFTGVTRQAADAEASQTAECRTTQAAFDGVVAARETSGKTCAQGENGEGFDETSDFHGKLLGAILGVGCEGITPILVRFATAGVSFIPSWLRGVSLY
jgi:hypothetical protein